MYAWSIFATPMASYLSQITGVSLTAGSLAIVFTITNSVGPITMITGGRINDKFGPKKVIFVGGLLFGGGMILSGFATGLGFLVFAYGILTGLGIGMVYGCTISNSIKFFPDKRGLEAAITAAKRGHEVIPCEKEGQLGGILKGEQVISFKHEIYELGVTLEKLAKDAGVEIRLNTTATKEHIEKENVDALIIVVGSEPLVPPILGLNGDNVVVVNDYYLESDKVTSDVVVLWGGLAGCEVAVHLAQEGKTVHLVEMRAELAPDANIRHRTILLKEIEKNHIHVHTEYKWLKVTEEDLIDCAPHVI